MKLLATIYLSLLCASACLIIHAYEKDIILEFKAAYFQPMNRTFRHIYSGEAIFGPEVTFNIWESIYGFASYNFLTKNGKSFGLETCTKIRLHLLGAGLKFFNCVTDTVSLYAGLGFQPVSLHTSNHSPYVIEKTHKWGLGGVVKMGTYIDLPCNFVLDIFGDYTFVKVKRSCCTDSSVGYIQQTNANVSGFSVGAGFGYRFN
jgi:hypothetical protein